MTGQSIVVYDGDCGICEASAQWIMKHAPIVRVVSHREYGLAHLHSVWLITNSGRLEGSRAVAEILRLSDIPAMQLFGKVIDLPVIRTVAAGVYWVIARNRRHISRLFGLKACGLPQNSVR